jgi:hypothetical protein
MKAVIESVLHDLIKILTGCAHQFDGGGLTQEEKMDLLRDYHR